MNLRMGESNIAHELSHRQITIRVDNGERPLSQYLADAQARIEQSVHYDKQKYTLNGQAHSSSRNAHRSVLPLLWPSCLP